MLLLFFFLAAVAVLVTVVIIVMIDFDDSKDPKDPKDPKERPKDPKDCEPQEGGCACTEKLCVSAATPRSLGWYFIKEKGYCEELFDDGCNGCQCDGTRFDSKEACTRSCPSKVCPAIYAPVCGADGETYASGCAKPDDVEIAYQGECSTCKPTKGCVANLLPCGPNNPERSIGWYFDEKKRKCYEEFSCNNAICDGTRFSTKNACDKACE